MKQIERNPDIVIGIDATPEGMTIIQGRYLMSVARALKIPFGVVYEKADNPSRGQRMATFGLLIRDEHVALIEAGIKTRSNKKSYYVPARNA
jgi:hypothetical protein